MIIAVVMPRVRVILLTCPFSVTGPPRVCTGLEFSRYFAGQRRRCNELCLRWCAWYRRTYKHALQGCEGWRSMTRTGARGSAEPQKYLELTVSEPRARRALRPATYCRTTS
jgi:hypothetical protein